MRCLLSRVAQSELLGNTIRTTYLAIGKGFASRDQQDVVLKARLCFVGLDSGVASSTGPFISVTAAMAH